MGSKAKPPAEPGSLNILVDVLVVDGVLDNFLGAEGDVSGGVEVGGPFMESTFAGSPGVNFCDLGKDNRVR